MCFLNCHIYEAYCLQGGCNDQTEEQLSLYIDYASGVKMEKIVSRIKLAFQTIWQEIMVALPSDFSRFRVAYYNERGCSFARYCSISPNVRIKGVVEMGEGSSIAQNCTISGESVGVKIGRNVMIAPNVVIVAFDHGYSSLDEPMVKQKNVEGSVVIENDVWISANSTIGRNTHIGEGCIVGANSFVRGTFPPYAIIGGVPARIIGSRRS